MLASSERLSETPMAARGMFAAYRGEPHQAGGRLLASRSEELRNEDGY
jgi:hypothetical protein